MENWAYIYILNEETEQNHNSATPEQGASREKLGAGDRASQPISKSHHEEGFPCQASFNCDVEEVSYPSYFFL